MCEGDNEVIEVSKGSLEKALCRGLLGSKGISLPASLMATALLAWVIFGSASFLLQKNKALSQITAETRFRFLQKSLDRALQNPLICQTALQGLQWNSNLDGNKNLAITVPGYSDPLRRNEPQAGSSWEPYLQGLIIREVSMESPAVVNAASNQWTAKLTLTIENLSATQIRLKAMKMEFKVDFVDGNPSPNVWLVAGCSGTTLVPGSCALGQYVISINPDGSVNCGTPADLIVNMRCPPHQYMWGFDFVSNQPHCQNLPYLGVDCEATMAAGARVKGFDDTGQPKCGI